MVSYYCFLVPLCLKRIVFQKFKFQNAVTLTAGSCTYAVLARNQCSIIVFKTLSYLYEVVCTNFSDDFLTFHNYARKLCEICGAT